MVEVYWITKDQIFYKIVLEPLVNMLRILKVQGDWNNQKLMLSKDHNFINLWNLMMLEYAEY